MTTIHDASAQIPVESRRARLRGDVALAAHVLPTHYPLETFIAVNPLAGLDSMPFEQAISRAADQYGVRGTLPQETFRELYRAGRITDTDLDRAIYRRYPNLQGAPALPLGEREVEPTELLRGDLLHGIRTPQPRRRYRTLGEQSGPEMAEAIDAQCAKWCSAFFGQAGWTMPGRDAGFFAAWRTLAPHDSGLAGAVRTRLRECAGRADDAVLNALAALQVDDDDRITYLQAHLTRLTGWAAHIRWCGTQDAGIDLVDYLAVRLTYEAALLLQNPLTPASLFQREVTEGIPSARERAEHLVEVWGLTGASDDQLAAAARVLAVVPVATREILWQNAFEGNYRDGLLTDIDSGRGQDPVGPVAAQLVCCIDTRSEGLRRHLEAVGPYQTLGFAGFFAVAIRYTDLLGGQARDLCPVLIRPSYAIREVAAPDTADRARRLAGANALAGAESAFHSAKDALAAPFALAEAAGWPSAPLTAAKTFAPVWHAKLRRRLRDLAVPAAPTVIDVDSIPMGERVLFGQVALTMMGLTDGFARLVVVCGHASTTENNPYQASLDCGACGGQPGGPNARTAAAILNEPGVRNELSLLGISIPAETYFVAAQHDTTTDRVTLLDEHLIPRSHHHDVRQLRDDLDLAGSRLAAERCAGLPGAPMPTSLARAARHVYRRSVDWAQVYPEWGLAGNAAFVIAPREVSVGIDLQRRVFLHSYDADVDPDGGALETILTAPLVVAQWINSQYYFSAVAPEAFGAGTKTIHNVVGTAGVIAGHNGDLRLGLPRQSVVDGERLIHEPVRLLAVVQAPLSRIDAIVGRNPVLQRLIGNDWIAVAARENSHQGWQRWTHSGWQSWDNTTRSMALREEEKIR
ncbi:MAG: DUF2309 domain-containing protein [Actinomycetia bacterium]|nr:DUF2309 domain-containing protein [Actinomycetes bacterium]